MVNEPGGTGQILQNQHGLHRKIIRKSWCCDEKEGKENDIFISGDRQYICSLSRGYQRSD
jgi:hypothetical protein